MYIVHYKYHSKLYDIKESNKRNGHFVRVFHWSASVIDMPEVPLGAGVLHPY